MGTKAFTTIGGVLLGGAVVLGVTNPSMNDYAGFATERALTYLEQDACTKKLPLIGNSFQDECVRTVKTPDFRENVYQLMLENTDRQNYGLFSLYKTDLSVQSIIPFLPNQVLPRYQAESIGILKLFRTYKTQENENNDRS